MTIEDHPHLPGKHASVHPCRHGAVMKKIIDVLMLRGVEPEVDKYTLISFLVSLCFPLSTMHSCTYIRHIRSVYMGILGEHLFLFACFIQRAILCRDEPEGGSVHCGICFSGKLMLWHSIFRDSLVSPVIGLRI